jgi:hypothetical protein
MNMVALVLMSGIAAAFLGLLLFALQYDHPTILILMGCVVAIAFAPWHWRGK